MKAKLTLFLLLILTFLCSYVAFAQTVNVTNFGVTPNNSSDDDQAGIKAAIQACQNLTNPILFFPEGTYHIKSNNSSGTYFWINNIDNLTIEGSGSTLLFMGIVYNRHIFQFQNCENLNVKNINIDYDNPPFSQGQIISSSSAYMDVQIFDGFDPTSKSFRSYAEYDNIKGQQLNQNESFSPNPTWQWQNQANNIVRINDNRYNIAKDKYLLIRHAKYDGYSFTFMRGCKNVVLDNVTVFKAPGYPFYANNGVENLTFLNTNIKKSSPDMWATATVDGAHLLDVRGEVVFDNCLFDGLCDDGINLHSYFFNITQAINNKTLRVQSKQTWHLLDGYMPGDTIEFFNRSTNVSVHKNVITNISNIGGGAMTVEFRDVLPSFPGGISNIKLSNISCLADLTVKNTTIRGNRSRGILVSTENVLIEGCTFDNNLERAILFEIWDNWYESTPARNVIIRNNTFDNVMRSRTDTRNAAIDIRALNSSSEVVCDVYKNISIVGNTFKNMKTPAVYAQNISGLEIRNNIIQTPSSTNGNLIRHGKNKNVIIANNTGASIDNMGNNCPDDSVIAVTGLTVTPPTATLGYLQTLQLTASIIPSNATNQTVSWTSSSPFEVNVSENGLVRVYSDQISNPITITATSADGSYTATSIITFANEVTPESIAFVTGPEVLVSGETVDVTVEYSVNEQRDIYLILQDTSDWTWAYQESKTVEAGTGTVTFNVLSNLPASEDGHQWVAWITTVGASWNEELAAPVYVGNVDIQSTLNVLNKDLKTNLSVYPNPAGDFVQVAIPNASLSNVQFKLYDMLGQLVYYETVDSKLGKWQINLSDLAQGIHILEIKADDQVMHHKVIKK